MRTKLGATALAAAMIVLAATSARAVEIQNLDSTPYTLRIVENGQARNYVLGAGRDEGSFCTSDCSIEVVGVGKIDPIDADAATARYTIMDGVLTDASNPHQDERDNGGHGHHGHSR
ncbi:MAG: hypothetical protein AB7F67_19840 [Rhodospirillaceae bacterium]